MLSPECSTNKQTPEQKRNSYRNQLEYLAGDANRLAGNLIELETYAKECKETVSEDLQEMVDELYELSDKLTDMARSLRGTPKTGSESKKSIIDDILSKIGSKSSIKLESKPSALIAMKLTSKKISQ